MGNKKIITVSLIDFPINFPSCIAAVVCCILVSFAHDTFDGTIQYNKHQ